MRLRDDVEEGHLADCGCDIRVFCGRSQGVTSTYRGAERRQPGTVGLRQRAGAGDRRVPVLALSPRLEKVGHAAAVAEAPVIENEGGKPGGGETLGERPESITARSREPVRHHDDRRRTSGRRVEPGRAGVAAGGEADLSAIHLPIQRGRMTKREIAYTLVAESMSTDPADKGANSLLLVEDNRSQAMIMERMLQQGGIELEVSHVTTLAAALELLGDAKIACVILDLTLPDADRLDGLMEIKNVAPEAPVVVVTADDDSARGVKAVQAGAQDYLVKGEMDSAQLCRSVRYAIERARSDLLLAHRALHDALTGLPNRMLFLDRLSYALAQSERQDTSVAIFFLDLDGFKGVNDRLGHLAGDALLRGIAGRLLTWVRPGDTVSRFGGDEFTVLVREVAGPGEAVEIAERLTEAVRSPLAVEGEDVSLIPSIGIALGKGIRKPEDLIERADQAMYSAKRRDDTNYEIAAAV
jgi:two-component system cell cycle response regulator